MQAVQKVQSLNLCPERSQENDKGLMNLSPLPPLTSLIPAVRRQRQADQPGLQSALGQTVPHLPTQAHVPTVGKVQLPHASLGLLNRPGIRGGSDPLPE